MRSESTRELARVLPAQDGLEAARAEEEAEALTPPSRLHRTARLLFLAIIAGCVAAVPAIVFHMRTHHYELHYICAHCARAAACLLRCLTHLTLARTQPGWWPASA